MLILTQMGGKLFRFLVIKAGFHFFPIQALSILTYLNSHGALAQLAKYRAIFLLTFWDSEC